MSKAFVDVKVYHDTEGNLTPMAIIWEDGTEYEIDRVLDVRRAASLKAGGMGMRYTVRILGKQRYLWLEQGEPPERWFVEGKEG